VKKANNKLWCAGLTLAACSFAASAQIYAGTSENGVVTLSNFGGDQAASVIVAAPEQAPEPIAPVVVAPAKPPSTTVLPAQLLPYILEASAASNLPPALIYAVIAVESNHNSQAVSHKGAQGLMQLMPATAKRFGGTNAFDARDNILTGSRYLRWLLNTFNQNVELAVAGYNAGENAVIRAGHQIPAYSETQKYVPKVLASFDLAKESNLFASFRGKKLFQK
jgi:soluble lytic murein transglycosylase-like protein